MLVRAIVVCVLAAASAACDGAGDENGTPLQQGLPRHPRGHTEPPSTTTTVDPAMPAPAPAPPPAPPKPAIACGTDADSIKESFRIALQRDATTEDLATYTTKIQAGETRLGVLRLLLQLEEFTSRRAPLSDVDFLIGLYRGFFDREPDAPGRAFWVDRLANGTTRSEVALGFAGSDEFKDPKSPANACYF